MTFHGNVRGKVRMNFLALLASKPHIFMRGALKLFRIAPANVRLNFAIPILFRSLIHVYCRDQNYSGSGRKCFQELISEKLLIFFAGWALFGMNYRFQ